MGKGVSTLGSAPPPDEDTANEGPSTSSGDVSATPSAATMAQISALSQAAMSGNVPDNLKEAMKLLNLVQGGSAKTQEEALRKHFKFWETQPVPKMGKSLYVGLRVLIRTTSYRGSRGRRRTNRQGKNSRRYPKRTIQFATFVRVGHS